MKLMRLSGLLLSLSLVALPALADDPTIVNVAGKELSFTLPEKTCAYNSKEAADAKILEAMEKADPRSQLLLAFLDCDDLKAIRGTEGAVYKGGYYGQILSNISGQKVADQYTRESYITALGTQYANQPAEQNMANGEQALRTMLAGDASKSQPQTLGVIRKDKDFLQIAVIGSQQLPNGTLQKVINIITLTKLGVPVSIYLGHPATPDMTLQALSEHAERYTHALIALNPDDGSLLARHLDLWSLAVGAAAGIIFSAIVGFIGLLVRRRQ